MSKGEQVIGSFWDLLNKMVWLDKYQMKTSLAGYKPSEVHCIEYVGSHADANVTRLADAFYMTRGAISKLTKKLIAKGLLECYRKPENKKEIYFRLTEQGRAIYSIHEKLHQGFRERDKAVFEGFPDAEFDRMLCFAKAYGKHLDDEIERLGVDLKNEDFDRL